MKPALAQLRASGYILVAYIDDLYLQGNFYEECAQNVIQTLRLFETLGFVIHPEKSMFIPGQRLSFLSFLIDSTNMTVTLTKEKIDKLKGLIQKALTGVQLIKIRSVAQIIGHMVASLPAVRYGALYY